MVHFATDSDQSPYSVQLVDGIQDVESKTFEARLSGTRGRQVRLDRGCVLVRGRIHQLAAGVDPGLRADRAAGQRPEHHEFGEPLGLRARRVRTSTDKLSLTAGVRYSTDQKDEEFDNSIVVTQLDTDESHFDWKAGIDYKFTDGFMAYASAATSYRPQAFNPRPFQVTQFVGVDGEEATSYEIGFKTRSGRQPPAHQPGRVLRRLQPAHPADRRHRVPGGQRRRTTSTSCRQARRVRSQDSLGQWCLDPNGPPPPGATTSRTFYNNIPATIQGAEFEFAVGADRRPDHQRPVRLHGLPG